ncbi:MAG: glycine--tRNA ligase subunit beta [Gammaproteobacteria bacterium]
MSPRHPTRDFLVEIGTEELPPLSLSELSQAFADGIVAGLAAQGVTHGAVKRYATPRRLAVLVRKVPERQPDQAVQRKGPPVTAAFDRDGKPTRAALAFAESTGTPVTELGRVQEPKGEFLFWSGIKPGAEVAALLPGLVQASLDKLPIAKRMRWGAGEATFVRPVHWVVLLWGRDVLPATLFDLAAGRHTRGHRFMAPREIALASPLAYEKALATRGRVVADFAARRERIRAGVLETAAACGGAPVLDEELLDEVTALVEWPVPVAGRFEERFLELPEQVLISTLMEHQRYFPVRGDDGKLTPWFITVSNIESRDPAQVRACNERVVRPRLTDAAFFHDTDRRHTLASREAGLAKVTYQAQLGSYADKAARVGRLAAGIAADVGADAVSVARAARLAKCDLLTNMVGEFPELQGQMGRDYARHDGEPAEVCAAVFEHYLPRFAGDVLPATSTGTVLALADKLDTLAGIFVIGQRPSGTRDPFGLRRAALGLLRIVLEGRLTLDLAPLVAAAVEAAAADVARVSGKPAAAAAEAAGQLLEFVTERLRGILVESGRVPGATSEMFEAVTANAITAPLEVEARLQALVAFLQLPAAAALAAANKRAANLLKKSEEASGEVDTAALVLPAEQALHAAIESMRDAVEAELAAGAYTAALSRLAELRAPVDAFFDGVMVNDQDPRIRANRLALLAGLRGLFLRVADLSRLAL